MGEDILGLSSSATSETTPTPESFGAKGDLTYVTDAAMTESSKTLTSATASFTSADVGKAISIRGPGLNANKNVLTSTIASVTNSTTVVLANAAALTVSNKVAVYGTDDTEAFRKLINKGVEDGIANGTNFAECLISGAYMIASASVVGGETKGNAQIPLPVIPTTGPKFRLCLRGPGRGAALLHWHQTAPQISGATLFSPLVAAEADGTYSVPSVIGGPTVLPEDEGTAGFSNMLLEINGALTILMPRHYNHMGLDLGLLAQADLDAVAVLPNASAAEIKSDADANAYSSNGEAIRLPKINNNDLAMVRSLSIEGASFGVGIGEHAQIDRLATIYCKVAMFVGPIGSIPFHGAHIGYWSCEGGTTIIQASGNAGGKFPLTINRLDVEDGSGVGTDFVDGESVLRGTVQFATNQSRTPTKTGAEHLTITNNNSV